MDAPINILRETNMSVRYNPGKQGSKHHNAVLKEEDVIEILKMIKDGYRAKTIAFLYNVKPSNISALKCGKSWRHISRIDYTITPAVSKPKIPKGKHSKLTDNKVIEILDRLADGEKQTAIAEFYGVTPPTISNINCGAIWKHIPRKPNTRIRTPKTAHIHANPKTKLTNDIARDIRYRLSIGEKQAAIAVFYNVSQATISSINVGITWKRAY